MPTAAIMSPAMASLYFLGSFSNALANPLENASTSTSRVMIELTAKIKPSSFQIDVTTM